MTREKAERLLSDNGYHIGRDVPWPRVIDAADYQLRRGLTYAAEGCTELADEYLAIAAAFEVVGFERMKEERA